MVDLQGRNRTICSDVIRQIFEPYKQLVSDAILQATRLLLLDDQLANIATL